MEKSRFVIESAEAKQMAVKSGLTLRQLLPTLVESAQSLARPSISKYPVGAVGLGSSGRIYIGVNLEFPGLPLHHSVHAEQFLITNLSINAEPKIESFAVSAAPCGHCRQFLQELRGAPEINILIRNPQNDTGESSGNPEEFNTLSYYLPERFGPVDLLEKDVPLLLENHNNNLSFSNGFSIVGSDLKYSALDAANMSHAPYSACPSGVALIDVEGKIYKGSYMESAAYNPSLGPLQTALVAFVANGGGGGYERIICAVLVEKEDAVVKQEHTAKLLLQCISPKCEFKVFHCISSKRKSI